MTSVTAESVVEVPVDAAYNQWTQFESFPEFMEGIEEVRQIDGRHIHWRANINGVAREWDAEITEQVPNKRIAWRGTAGFPNAGAVTFAPVGPAKTRVVVDMGYEPQGWVEKAGDFAGFISRRVDADVKRFKKYVEQQGHER